MQQLQWPDRLMSDIKVWRLDLSLDAAVPAVDWALLVESERDHALRLHRHEDRVRFVRARAALRRLLARRLRCAPRMVPLAAGPRGKPRLATGRANEDVSDFNVSHAGRFALIALARRGAVGVDIECRMADLDAVALESQVLSPSERALDAREQPEFHERWVVKEAVLKSLGLGVAEHLQRVSVGRPASGNRRYGLRCSVEGWPPIEAWRLDAPSGYAAALAWTETTPTVQLR